MVVDGSFIVSFDLEQKFQTFLIEKSSLNGFGRLMSNNINFEGCIWFPFRKTTTALYDFQFEVEANQSL